MMKSAVPKRLCDRNERERAFALVRKLSVAASLKPPAKPACGVLIPLLSFPKIIHYNAFMSKQHIVSALVENRAGTLSRVSGLFSRRGFNIDSLTVGETEDPSISRLTIAVQGGAEIEQVVKQLGKLVDVIAVRELDKSACIRRGIMLVKVGADEKNRPNVIQVAGIFRARIIDVSAATVTIEATGDAEKLEGLLLLLRPYGILELARTGLTALERGSKMLTQ